MYVVFFYLVPLILFLVSSSLQMVIRFGIPEWLRQMGVDASIGGLHYADIENMSKQERQLLSRVVGGYMTTTLLILVVVSTVLVLQGHAGNLAMSLLCAGVELAAGLLILRPMGKAARGVKKRR